LRLFEFGTVYRDEKSGVLSGLTRVRMITQDDSHSYVTAEQAPAEIKHLLDFVLSLLRDFGMNDFYLELSTRDDEKEKFVGSEEDCGIAERSRDVFVLVLIFWSARRSADREAAAEEEET